MSEHGNDLTSTPQLSPWEPPRVWPTLLGCAMCVASSMLVIGAAILILRLAWR